MGGVLKSIIYSFLLLFLAISEGRDIVFISCKADLFTHPVHTEIPSNESGYSFSSGIVMISAVYGTRSYNKFLK